MKTNIITWIKRFGLLLIATTCLAFSVAGCNTAQGFGKDVEKTGEAIQDGTK